VRSSEKLVDQGNRHPSEVPDLTRSGDIKLNGRVPLRSVIDAISSSRRRSSPFGSAMAKPSVDHVPAGGFVPL
jgi:hypothetical protein